ncbi:MAG: hypothetical protein E7536_07490 [Ruminococcaceae bacterium]|nr:hypothetical protein [Oscillospiraceae bacterium]
MERKLITKSDIILLVVFVLVVVFAFVFKNISSDNLVAEIYFDGEIIDTVNLSEKEEKVITTGTHHKTVIRSDKGRIYFLSSCCEDDICVESGLLEKNGDFASCLPEKVIIKVRSEKKDNIDAIVY